LDKILFWIRINIGFQGVFYSDYVIADYVIADYVIADYFIADYFIADYFIADYFIAAIDPCYSVFIRVLN